MKRPMQVSGSSTLMARTRPSTWPLGAEWNERYGSYIAQAHAWRLTALASLAVAFVAVTGVVWIGAQNRVVPYVVQTDKLGDALAISRADIAAPADPRTHPRRTGSMDRRCPCRLSGRGCGARSGEERIRDGRSQWRRRTSNSTTGSHTTIRSNGRRQKWSASRSSLSLPISGSTWRVEWREDTRGRDGMANPSAH